MSERMAALTFIFCCSTVNALLARSCRVRGWHWDDVVAMLVLVVCGCYWAVRFGLGFFA